MTHPAHATRYTRPPTACPPSPGTYSALMSYGLRDLDGVRVELCDECGFDEREPRDLATAFAEVYASLERLQGHADAGRRPEADTWSGAEYAEHCVDGADQTLAICRRATARRSSPATNTARSAARRHGQLGAGTPRPSTCNGASPR